MGSLGVQIFSLGNPIKDPFPFLAAFPVVFPAPSGLHQSFEILSADLSICLCSTGKLAVQQHTYKVDLEVFSAKWV